MQSTGERRKPAAWPQNRNGLLLIVVVVLTLSAVLQDFLVCGATTFGRRPAPAESTASSAKRQKTNNNNNRKVMEPAFENAGQEAGLEIWRIEVSNDEFVIKPQYC